MSTLDDALTRRLRREQSRQRLPSVAAAVVRDGQIRWSASAGHLNARSDGPLATTATQYRIGSITKTFVAVEIMRLREAGRIELDTVVGDLLPELAHLGPVTIAHLLTHTSGLQAETDTDWWERSDGLAWSDLVASGIGQRFAPSTRYHYSNVGYGVLGEVVARLHGVPWTTAVSEQLLAPLGMQHTTARPTSAAAPGLAVHPFADLVHVEPEFDGVAMAPAGQLWSSVDDLARWAIFLGGDTAGLLSGDTLADMVRPVALNDVPTASWTSAHALGWQVWNVGGRRFAGHGGSMPGFLAGLRVDLESGDGVVVLTNATSGLGTLADDLLALTREHEPAEPTPWTVDAAQTGVLDLVGDWFWGTVRFTVRATRHGGLQLGEPGVGRGARFAPTSQGWIGVEGYYSGEWLVVRRDDAGRACSLELASFVFTRTPYDPAAPIPGGVEPSGWH